MKPEQKEQKAIIDYLRLRGYFVYKNSSVGIYIRKTDKYIPAQTKGIADLTAIKDGKVYQIEVKAPNGRQLDNQKEFQKEWEKRGGVYILGGFEEVINQLKKTI